MRQPPSPPSGIGVAETPSVRCSRRGPFSERYKRAGRYQTATNWCNQDPSPELAEDQVAAVLPVHGKAFELIHRSITLIWALMSRTCSFSSRRIEGHQSIRDSFLRREESR